MNRWTALDAFRGLAIVGMLLVNNPGDHDAVYAPLRHSAWNGCTFADLVFPFFLFVAGITTAIARRHTSGDGGTTRIWRRAAIIFCIGLALNWFPFYQSGPIAWTDHPTLFDRIVARLLILRIPGVLQRIAVAYVVAALIARRARSRTIAFVTAAILVGYWILLTAVPVPGEGLRGIDLLDQPARTIVAHVDRGLFDWTRWGLGNHLWDSALTWDPEGALSTFPAIATVLLGVLCGRWMLDAARPKRVAWLAAAGLCSMIAGWTWSIVLPLNKALWTSSYVLFTAGVAALVLAGITAALEGRRSALWAAPLITFGVNPLIAYAGSELARRILHSSIKVRSNGHLLGTDEWTVRILERAGVATEAASLAWALLFLVLCWAALRSLDRRGLFLRV